MTIVCGILFGIWFHAIIGDDTNRTLTWKSGANVSALAGKTIRLRWVRKDTDMFAFRFQ